MIKFLSKKFFSDKFPPVYIHIYYIAASVTLCYLYFHKFINIADFYGSESTGGIYAVLDFEASKPVQFRLFIPFLFKAFKFILPVSNKALFFFITIVLCYFILLSFYYLLNRYFQNNERNYWVSSVILYPIVWNLIILNGQFFYMDFSALLIIILGFYFIVSDKFISLIILFLIGVTNHPSVGYLIPAFLLYRYKELLNLRTWIFTVILVLIYIVYYSMMEAVFSDRQGYFVLNNFSRNMSLFSILPAHIIIRDIIFNFGGIHIIVLILLISGLWKKYISPLLMINLVIVPYVISVFISFSIEEIRNYSAIIPFIIIPALIYISNLELLKPVDNLFTERKEQKKEKVHN